MALRVYSKVKVLISHDNNSNPAQVAFNSGDVENTDTATYNEESSKTLKLNASTTDQQVSLDSIAQAGLLFIKSPNDTVSVKIVPPGKVLGDVSAYTLKANQPLVMPCDAIAVYVSNSSSTDPAYVTVAAAGN